MDDCNRPASAKPSDLRKAELHRHPCTNPNKGKVQSDCLSGQGKLLQQQSHTRPAVQFQLQFWLDWFQSASCLHAGPLPTSRCHAWGAEVTLRADAVAMNKSEGLWTEEPQLHSDLWKRSRRLRLSQFCSSCTLTFGSFSVFRRIFAVFLPLYNISRELIKVYFLPSQLLNK